LRVARAAYTNFIRDNARPKFHAARHDAPRIALYVFHSPSIGTSCDALFQAWNKKFHRPIVAILRAEFFS
jgi:hypothetical protein